MWTKLVSVGVLGVAIGGTAVWLALPEGDEGTNPAPPIARDSREPPADPTPFPTQRTSIAEIVRNAHDFQRNTELYALLAETGRAEVEALLAEIGTLDASPHRYDVARVLYTRFAGLDPQAAADHVVAANYHSSWVAAVFRAWAHTDVDAAVDRATALEGDAKTIAAQAILELDLPAWQREEIAAQLGGERILVAISAREALTGGGQDFASAWRAAVAALDIPQEPNSLEQVGSWVSAFEQLALLARRWANHDPVAAMAAVADTGNRQFATLSQTVVLQAWAADDPLAAVAWFAAQHGEQREGRNFDRENLSHALMQGLMERGVDEAIRALDSIPAPLQQQAGLGLVRALRGRDIGDGDFQSVLDWYDTFDAPSNRLSTELSRAYAAHDPAQAIAWAQTLDGRARSDAFRTAASQLARSDPELATRLVAEIEDPQLRTRAAMQIMFSQGLNDPEATLQWARSFPVEDDRPQLELRAITLWADAAPRAATREVLAMRDAQARDEAAARIVRTVARNGHADLAEDLFNATQSESVRRRVAAALLHHYTETAPDEAKAEFYRGIVPTRRGARNEGRNRVERR